MTIGELAKEFGLSRGTLLHYDAIGLLKPSHRTDSDYRVYTADDVERLRAICMYRSAGMTLASIAAMLDAPQAHGYAEALRHRLAQLTDEIATAKRQQTLIVRLLAEHGAQEREQMLNKEQFVALMRKTGLSDDDMHRWHKEFEKMSGDAHEEFLTSLGIDAEEIKQIRAWSRG